MNVSSVPHAPFAQARPEPRDDLIHRRVLLLRPLDSIAVPHHWNPEFPKARLFEDRGKPRVGSSSLAFMAALAERGWDLSDVVVRARLGEGLCKPAFPRDVRWRDLPVAGEARIEWGDLATRELVAEGHGSGLHGSEGVQELSPSTEAVVVDCRKLDAPVLWNAVGPIWETVRTGGVRVLWFDGIRMREVEASELEAAADFMRPLDRLAANFTLNFTVMVSRAVASVAGEDGWTRSAYRRRMPTLGGFTLRSFDPLAVQMLYALDRMHVVEGEPRRDDDILRGWDATFRACPWIDVADDGRATFTWRGTGRFPAFSCEVDFPNSHSGFVADAEGHGIWFSLAALGTVGFIALDGEGRMGVTPYGRRILGKVGRSAEDPDVILRWRGGGEASVPAVDRWLHKAFRAMKRRVADLPASPFLETEDGEDTRDASANHRLAYGGFVRLGARMDDAEVAEAVARVVSEQSARKPWERRLGLIASERHVPSERPDFLWFGVPVGVASEVNSVHGMTGWYGGLDGLAKDVQAASESVPAVLRSMMDADADWLLRIGDTDEPESGPLLASTVDLHARWKSTRVMAGWVVEVADVAGCGGQARTGIGFMNMRMAPFSGGTSLSIQGSWTSKNTATCWQGQEIGHFDDGGALATPTASAPRLARHVASQLASDRANLRRLGTPEAGEPRFGIWTVEDGKAPVPFPEGHAFVDAVMAEVRKSVAALD